MLQKKVKIDDWCPPRSDSASDTVGGRGLEMEKRGASPRSPTPSGLPDGKEKPSGTSSDSRVAGAQRRHVGEPRGGKGTCPARGGVQALGTWSYGRGSREGRGLQSGGVPPVASGELCPVA